MRSIAIPIVPIVLATAFLGACARPAQSVRSAPPADAGAGRPLARGPARVTARTAADSDAVRRLCVAPDSVLAGRAECVLRRYEVFRIF